jgi:hypothetical protein
MLAGDNPAEQPRFKYQAGRSGQTVMVSDGARGEALAEGIALS